jgi:hypothetical protein
MPRLELKSSRSFLAIKRCQRTKSKKVIKRSRSSLKSWAHIAPIAVKLLNEHVQITLIFLFENHQFHIIYCVTLAYVLFLKIF